MVNFKTSTYMLDNMQLGPASNVSKTNGVMSCKIKPKVRPHYFKMSEGSGSVERDICLEHKIQCIGYLTMNIYIYIYIT